MFIGCTGSSSLLRLSLVVESGGLLTSCGAWASLQGGSLVVDHTLQGVHASAVAARGLSSGVQAWLLHGLWDLPGPGIKPVSPALAGRF